MARTLTGTIRAAFGLDYRGDADLGSQQAKLPFADDINIASGNGSGQANLCFFDKRTIAGSGSESLDLAGVLTDAFGQTLTFTRIKAIMIRADAGNAGNIVVGGAPSNGFVGPFADATDKARIAAGDVFLVTNMAAGWTVTAATGDLLLIANSGASAATYDIAIIGLS